MSEELKPKTVVATQEKPWWQSKKVWATAVAVLTAVIPVVMESIPKESSLYAILGGIAAIVAYVTGQSKVDAASRQAGGLIEASKSNPTQPAP